MILVFILNIFVKVESYLLIKFVLGSLGVILGLSIFLSGIDLSVSKIGTMMGDFLGRFDKISKVLIFGLFLGFIISMAEPDLLILANEVSLELSLNSWFIVAIISAGVGVMIAIGLYRIFKEISISKLMWIVYLIIFGLMAITDNISHAIAFDASGATTGAMTTPFIIALGLGVANLKGEHGEENSFGLVGMASAGPILAALLMSLFTQTGQIEIAGHEEGSIIISGIINASLAILPLSLVFFTMNHKYFKMEKDEFKEILLGLIYTYFGLILFLISVEAGFMDLARVFGESLRDYKILPLIGFVLGLLVVLAEPAVAVLAEQVEDVTGGSIPKRNILKALSIGVALAVMLAVIRIKTNAFSLWMVIVPGFLLSLIISRKVPQLFVGIAFDSGGVASGPMTATFILAFCQGVAGNVADGFGVISFVAMMPVLTIMIMGYLYKRRN